MHPDAPYAIILLCLMPDHFTCQGESAANQWVKMQHWPQCNAKQTIQTNQLE
jgi:hypothetical protein